jgi:hypothetical protein
MLCAEDALDMEWKLLVMNSGSACYQPVHLDKLLDCDAYFIKRYSAYLVQEVVRISE